MLMNLVYKESKNFLKYLKQHFTVPVQTEVACGFIEFC